MRRAMVGVALCLIVVGMSAAEAPYVPPPGQWAHKAPGDVGMDAARLNEAIAFMKTHETTQARDFSDQETASGRLS